MKDSPTAMRTAPITLLALLTLLATTLAVSCSLEPMEEGESVNEYIFPYIDFTLSEDESYYTAAVVDGASLVKVYIPSYVDDAEEGFLPVKFFDGFEGAGDEANLRTVVFESSDTVPRLEVLDEAGKLYTIRYDNVVGEGLVYWTNLPTLPHTDDEEFLGWFLESNGARIRSGDVMVPGYSTVNPGWGSHSYGDEVDGVAATCTNSGYTSYKVCSSCGHSTKREIPALGHEMVFHSQAAATCTQDGYTAGVYECMRCGLFFLDTDGTEPVDKADVFVPRTGHQNIAYTPVDGTTHSWECSVCGLSGTEDHEFGDWVYESGLQHRTCAKCGYTQTDEASHTWVLVPAVESTCKEQGHKEYWKCNVHDGEYSLDESHSSFIGEERLLEEIGLPLADHTPSADYSHDDCDHWHECTVCGEKLDKESHTFEYTFEANQASRILTVRRICTVCKAEGSRTSSGGNAFDVSSAFGQVTIERVDGRNWNLSYTGTCNGCYWTDSEGNILMEGPEAFSIAYSSQGSGTFKVFCYSFDGRRELIEIAFAELVAY